MRGLSTIGSISFGLAFVTGRKRVPRPATGNTAFVIFFISFLVVLARAASRTAEQCAHRRLVDHLHAERLRPGELAARLRAGDDVIRLFRYAARDLGARRL